MKKSVLTAFITVVCATSSVMAADDNAITDGSVTFNGKVIAPACTLVAATKDSVVTLPDVSATKLQTNGQVSGVQTDVPIELKDCDTTVTKNATFTFNGTADATQITAFANQASSDAATNVALQMYMNDGTTAIKPDTETGNILLQDGDQTLTFKVDYIATGKATSGNVNAVTNF
ncbi:TPA: fimbrial protein, partial [Escherichia coli]|nr:fimbrial protein [Escherichia coli]HBB6524447.1 fimbrial protein [Escherichia coli]HCN6429110.1 fimbrial protein [Escherichia coli]HDX9357648.1 fimbrial protein [Escherichia coli]